MMQRLRQRGFEAAIVGLTCLTACEANEQPGSFGNATDGDSKGIPGAESGGTASSGETGAACASPCEVPEASCEDSNAIVPISAECVAGRCEVTVERSECDNGCEAGACIGNSACDNGCEPRTAFCEGSAAVRDSEAGVCDAETATCDYSGVTETIDCAAQGQMCSDGMCVAAAACCQGQAPVEIELQARERYLRNHGEFAALPPAMVELATLGFCPGDPMRVTTVGSYNHNAMGEEISRVGAVFSGSATVLDGSAAHRVPDALEAGNEMVTQPTYHGQYPTDIPEDFQTNGQVVTVPEGTQVLLLGVPDPFVSDNAVGPDGLFVRLECAAPGVG